MRLSADDQRELVTKHLPIAKSLVSCYRGYGIPEDDLFQEACLGLVEAARRFDPNQIPEAHFGEYARSQALKRVVALLKSEIKNQLRCGMADIPEPEEHPAAERAENELWSAIDTLDSYDRQLIRDRLNGQSVIELSTSRHTSAHKIRRRLDEIRHQLRLELIQRGWSARGAAPRESLAQLNTG